MVLGQLLCARLCHDLIGPATAINAGEELLRGGEDAEAGDLLAESARQLAGRLTFFRALFGHAGGAAVMRTSELRALADGYLTGRRIVLSWELVAVDGAQDDGVPGEIARIMLCLIMLAADALPRGGRVVLHADLRGGPRLSVTAAGKPVRLADDVRDALHATRLTGVTARTVHAFYLSRLLRSSRGALDFDASIEGELRIDVAAPADRSRLSHAA
jgi:histidine phosphotransferase ChpT